MGHRLAQGSDERFAAYVEEIASVIGHADRVGPLEAYCIGLLLPSERKSVEPMAAVTAPERFRSAPIAVAFHQPRRVVGQKGAGEGA